MARRNRLFLPVLAILLLATTCSPAGFARKQAKPPTLEQVSQVWTGWSKDNLYLVRLALLSNGKGMGGYTFLGEEPRTFQINSWKYGAGQIEISPVKPQGQASWVSPLRGTVNGFTMELTASGDGWDIAFSLRPEAEWEEKLKKIRAEMAQGNK